MFDSEFEENLFNLRKEKLAQIVQLGQATYPSRFPVTRGQTATPLSKVRADWDQKLARSSRPSARPLLSAGA